MWSPSKIIPSAIKLDGFYSLGDWVLWAFCGVTGFTVSGMIAWAFSTWGWFWDTFRWAGIAMVALVSWIILPLGFLLYAKAVQAWRPASRIFFAAEMTGCAAGIAALLADNENAIRISLAFCIVGWGGLLGLSIIGRRKRLGLGRK